ncbi:MAG: four helix bundle protein [Kofleriaceae bacterium]
MRTGLVRVRPRAGAARPRGRLGSETCAQENTVKNMNVIEIDHPHAPSSNGGPSPTTFVAYEAALEMLRALVPVVEQLKRHNADLADQVVRAGSSVTLNLSEGSGCRGRDRKRFFQFAQGSAKEIRGALDTAEAWGWRVQSAPARVLLDRVLALLWGLCK